MKKYSLLILLLSALCSLPAYAQRHVSQERMAEVYEEAKTPYKYGLVVAPSTNDAKIDCPTVFRDGDKWYMTYVIYDGRGAKDGRGYETWLAESDNLLEWRTLAVSSRGATACGTPTSVPVSRPSSTWSGAGRMPSSVTKAVPG